MNRGQIRSAVADALRNTSYVRWTSAEIDLYIDDGYREIANRTGCVVATSNLTCEAGEHFVDLPDATLYPIAFRDITTGLPVGMCHWTLIDTDDNFFMRKERNRTERVAAWGLKKLLLSQAYSVQSSLEMMAAVSPVTGLASDGTEPDLPQQHHQALVDYAHYRALIKDADGPRLGRALRQYGYYLEKVEALTEWAEARHEGIAQAMYGNWLRTESPGRGWL